MNINFNKKTIFIVLAILWFGFSSIYIGLDIWNNFKAQQLANAFETGRVETINQIMQRVTEARCQPIRLFNEEGEVSLIDIACLEQPEPAGPVEQIE